MEMAFPAFTRANNEASIASATYPHSTSGKVFATIITPHPLAQPVITKSTVLVFNRIPVKSPAPT